MTATSATVLLNRLQAKARMRHLQVLVTVAELRSLKRAAEVAGLSQPAITQLLADLEQLLEVRLFDRHARGVRLTAAGQQLLPVARRILDTLAEGTEAVTALKQGGAGTVRLAALTGAIAGLLVRAAPGFTQAHPGITLLVSETGVEEWGLRLARGEADLAACREPATPPAGFRFMPLVQDRFVIACGTAHPLAGRRVGWPRLFGQQWLVSPTGTAARTLFDQLTRENNAQPALNGVVTRVSSLTWALLSAQPLLTLVPYAVVRQLVEAGQLALIEPPRPLPLKPLGLVVPDEAQPAVTTFVDWMRGTDWSA